MGGGPGGPIPFRIYIDSGVVFMALVSITPIAPLLAPASLVYFLYCSPLLRRNLIFLYRPTFDAGKCCMRYSISHHYFDHYAHIIISCFFRRTSLAISFRNIIL